MANVDFPRGFIPIEDDCKMHMYPVASNNAQIGEGDLLERRSDGFIHPAQATSVTIIGVAAYNLAANSGTEIGVYDDTDTIYRAQVDDATVDAQTDLDLNYNIVASTPDTLTGRSTMEIDGSTQAATATLPIKILRVANIISQAGNALGNHVAVDCIINNHLLKSTGVNG